MEISTFELLVKPIAPRILGNPAITAVARRVVQGYFLTISNLDSKDLTFRLEFVQSNPNPVDPDRSLLNNADLIFDIAGANNPITLTALPANRFRGSFRLPAGQTASVQLLPRLTPPLLAAAEPDLEVRGYVSLTLPALRRPTPPFSLFTEPQSDAPVKVLLNPEVRGTFLPNNFPTATNGDFDQINYPLAIASGKGLNEIVPEPGGPIIIRPIDLDLLEPVRRGLLESRFAEADNLEKSQTLVELMAQLDRSPENLQGLSDLLSKLDIPVQVMPA
ncbi:hypothetical protein H6F67_22885 [Microcoleus sp. FACHB-1515]|uniref:hypothetical protein n=1 Tax=Cyanophyceae TaxID=3028117 RepID=UPI001689B93C|nr:hypothetical protein [Microcoleus sp. FACHB-1515]MBD2092701.1 hypothetical protein [Microcoleus sp. FACHB-1515]